MEQPENLMMGPLPLQPTPFIGRTSELQELRSVLNEPHNRLVSLVGLGGVGKTRLAIAAAEQQVEHYGSNIVFIPLLALHSWEQVVTWLAHVLRVQLHS